MAYPFGVDLGREPARWLAERKTARLFTRAGYSASAACRGLEFAGLRLNYNANAKPLLDQDISALDSSVRVLVIRAEEDWAIAKECWKLTHTRRPQKAAVN